MSVHFYSSPAFVQVRPAKSFIGRLLGRVEVVPYPTLIKLSGTSYFGHPETVARVSGEVERYGAMIGKKVTRVSER